ncbi:MAG: radical SAM protein [Marinilabiliales bacterium]|nr:MAG: radical SAM protein [Marinilabiliales bacterium]
MDERFSWVDEFISNVKPYIFVRQEDAVLIKRPNVVQKLNPMGAAILRELLDGNSISDILGKINHDVEKADDIYYFLSAVRKSLDDELDVHTLNPAVEKKPLVAPFTSLPVLSELAVTYRCNFRCSFCYAGINCTRDAAATELSTAELKELIYKIRFQAQVPSISFTGGEPTLRKDLPELIAYAKEIDMRVNLISNGYLIDEKLAKAMKEAGLDSAQLSLEGATEETHDVVVGVKGAYQQLLKAVKHLEAEDIRVHTNTTLSLENVDEAVRLPGFLKELGMARFSMNLVIPTGSAKEHEKILLPYSRAGEIVTKIYEESKRQDIEFMWYSPLPLCMFNTITAGLGNKGCAACDGLLSVDPEGNIIPCASWDEPMGNLLNNDFESIWHTDRSTQIRNKMETHPLCRECDSFHSCQGACPLYWNMNGYGELDKIFEKNKELMH